MASILVVLPRGKMKVLTRDRPLVRAEFEAMALSGRDGDRGRVHFITGAGGSVLSRPLQSRVRARPARSSTLFP